MPHLIQRRRLLSLIVTMAALFVALAGTQAGSAQAATHYYQDLTSRNTGLVTNVGFFLGDKTPGAVVRLYDDTGPNDTNSQWEEINTDAGWVTLKNRWSGLCMDVASTSNNAKVFQAACDTTYSQKWRSRYDLTASSHWGAWENRWSASNGLPDRVLTIANSADHTSPLVLWHWYAGDDQQWHYETEAHS